MATRVEGVHPAALARRIGSSPLITALFAAILLMARERFHRISVPRMSDEWLTAHERDGVDER